MPRLRSSGLAASLPARQNPVRKSEGKREGERREDADGQAARLGGTGEKRIEELTRMGDHVPAVPAQNSPQVDAHGNQRDDGIHDVPADRLPESVLDDPLHDLHGSTPMSRPTMASSPSVTAFGTENSARR